MNLGLYLDNAVEKYCEKPVLRFYDDTITYKEFGQKVNKLAHGLRKLGFKKGDFIHVYVQNRPEVLAAYFAIQKIGAVAGPINGWWKGPEIEYLLNDSKGVGLIIEDQYLETFDAIRGKCPHLKTIIEIGEKPRAAHVSFAQLVAESPDSVVTSDAADRDIAYIFYTSGTTGNPKGVLLSHKNVLTDVAGVSKALGLEPKMTVLCFLPLFHVNAMMTFVSSLEKGHQIVLRRSFSAKEFWEVVDKYKVNFWSAVPAVYQILLTDPGRQKYDLSSLQFGVCGAAPLTRETMQTFEQTFKIPIVEGYGLTEVTCVSTLNPRAGVRKIGSIGLALPLQDIRIFDEDGKECPVGTPGEICIKSDAVMEGYFNRPEETAQTIVGGYLRTGDVAYKDSDGYFFIVDRKKEMVIRGGENIYPKEIDNLLASHPKIQEAATIGVPDPVMGEEVKVFVIPKESSLSEQEVIDYCKQHLAAFKVPRYVEIIDEDFPRSAVGKVMKKVLKQWGLTPRPKAKKGGATVEDIFGTMEARVRPEGIAGVEANYGYVVTGEGGGEWTVMVHQNAVQVKKGLHEPNVTTTIAARDWIDITLGKLDGMTAFSSGKMKVEGDMSLLLKAPKFFKKYTPPKPVGEATVEDIFGTMEARVRPEGIAGVEANYGYVVTGEGGGEWTVMVHQNAVQVKKGLHEPNVTTTIAARDWIAITLGTLDGMTAFSSGKMKVEGDMSLLLKAPKFFKKYTPPKPAGEATVEDIFGTMEARVRPEGIAGVEANYGYVITGEGGGEWTVIVHDDTVKVQKGLHNPSVTTTIAARDWIAITLGKLDGMTAFSSGKMKVEGDMSLLLKAPKFFKKYTPPSAAEEAEEPKKELIVLRQTLSINHRFDTGPLMGKFLTELRDHKRILGNRCPKCGRMQAPPREVCAVCRVRVDELVEIGPEAVVTDYDIAYYASPDPLTGQTRKTPYCSAFLLLEGCRDNEVFWHEINPEHIDRVKKGVRVRPVWAEKRTGAITDILYFDVIS